MRDRFLRGARIRRFLKDMGKQTSPEFLVALDAKVETILYRAVANARGFKRLKAAELI